MTYIKDTCKSKAIKMSRKEETDPFKPVGSMSMFSCLVNHIQDQICEGRKKHKSIIRKRGQTGDTINANMMQEKRGKVLNGAILCLMR